MSKRARCIAIFTKRNNEDSRKVSYLLREKLAEQGISVIDYTREYDSRSPGLGIDVDVNVDEDTPMDQAVIMQPGLSIELRGTKRQMDVNGNL